MRNAIAISTAALTSLTGPARADVFTDTFDDGHSAGGWTLGGLETFPDTGGNPGWSSTSTVTGWWISATPLSS